MELVNRLGEQLPRLVREELLLAQAELTHKGKQLGVGGGLAAGAGVVGWFSFGAFVAAAVAGIAVALPVWAAALIVAAVLVVLAGVLGVLARKQATKAIPPVPEQAVAGARRDFDTIKESAHR